MFNTVLVGVDGRQGGRDAVALAKQLAAPGAALTLAHVYGAGLMPPVGADLLLAEKLKESEKLLERERSRASVDAQLAPYAERSVGHGLHELAEQQESMSSSSDRVDGASSAACCLATTWRTP